MTLNDTIINICSRDFGLGIQDILSYGQNYHPQCLISCCCYVKIHHDSHNMYINYIKYAHTLNEKKLFLKNPSSVGLS